MPALIAARNTGPPAQGLAAGSSNKELTKVKAGRAAAAQTGRCKVRSDRAPAQTATAPPTSNVLPNGLAQP